MDNETAKNECCHIASNTIPAKVMETRILNRVEVAFIKCPVSSYKDLK
jgi:hypothetical protein